MASLFFFLFLYHIKQIDSVLPCICSVVDPRKTWYENHESHNRLTARLSQMFLPHFDAVRVLFLKRRTTTRNLKNINILMEIKKTFRRQFCSVDYLTQSIPCLVPSRAFHVSYGYDRFALATPPVLFYKLINSNCRLVQFFRSRRTIRNHRSVPLIIQMTAS